MNGRSWTVDCLVATVFLLASASTTGLPALAQPAGDRQADESASDRSDVMERGLSIALTGMTIVFVALALISLFIEALPRVLAIVARVFPVVAEPEPSAKAGRSNVSSDDEAVLAAIGYVLHTEMSQQAGPQNQQSVG
jgi:Na+-transporting methylmalonyl-CoA/oxaloacetate decarboxylase gamma subunit